MGRVGEEEKVPEGWGRGERWVWGGRGAGPRRECGVSLLGRAHACMRRAAKVKE